MISSASRMSAAILEVFVPGSAFGGIVAEPPDAVKVLPRLIEKGSAGAFSGDLSWAGTLAATAVAMRKTLKMRLAWYIGEMKNK